VPSGEAPVPSVAPTHSRRTPAFDHAPRAPSPPPRRGATLRLVLTPTTLLGAYHVSVRMMQCAGGAVPRHAQTPAVRPDGENASRRKRALKGPSTTPRYSVFYRRSRNATSPRLMGKRCADLRTAHVTTRPPTAWAGPHAFPGANGNTHTALCDVSICGVFQGDGVLKPAAGEPGGVAKAVEKARHEKHNGVAGGKLVPLVMEQFGRRGEELDKFMSTVAKLQAARANDVCRGPSSPRVRSGQECGGQSLHHGGAGGAGEGAGAADHQGGCERAWAFGFGSFETSAGGVAAWAGGGRGGCGEGQRGRAPASISSSPLALLAVGAWGRSCTKLEGRKGFVPCFTAGYRRSPSNFKNRNVHSKPKT
jgi:hypothetical protein